MSDSPEHVQSDSLPRVAVIAVHGVNTNQPFETARSIAKMLLRHSSDLSEYPEFKETAEHIFVERVKIGVADTGGHEEDHTRYWFDERAPSIRRAQQRRGQNGSSDRQVSDIPLDHQYMTDQLRRYSVEGKDAFYDTIRIEGIRSNAHSEHRCCVHVFELFWADLSRRAFGVFQGFIELYEILFFLCSLGRKTLDFARATHPKSFWWWSFGSAQVMAERILVLAIPVINLCMLAIGSILLPALFDGPRVFLSALIVLYATAISAVLIVATLGRWLDGDGARWPIIFAPLSLIALVAGYLSQGITDPAHEYRTLASLWALTALLGVIVICRLYDRMRRGAMLSGVIATGLTVILLAKELWSGSAAIDKTDQFYVLDRVVRTGEWLLTALNVAWIALLLFLFLMTVSDWFATRYACRCKFPERCQRAAWTAQLTILLPASLVVILTSAFWKILTEFLTRLPGKDALSTAHTTPIRVPYQLANFLPHGVSQLQDKAGLTVQDAIGTMINALGDDLVPLCIVLGVATALAIWALLPVIIAEIQPPKRPPTQAKSHWLGSTLNAGYKTLRLSGEIVRWTLLAGFASCAISLLGQWPRVKGSLDSLTNALHIQTPERGAALIAILGCAVGFLLTASQGPLSFLTLGFKSVIDVALDVVAWLRLRPETQNPKGRICARYVSLLRHICKEHLSGATYKGIVIVAHSQGTIISADLLRFLYFQHGNSELDSTLAPLFRGDLPVYLMTFGSPLRQLYDLRFPDLYAWTFRPDHATNQGPHPKTLGVRGWLNGYRSGDYVGRYLWHRDNDPAAWNLGSVTHEPGLREECCFGEGAHTHYFDETAPSVPVWLNRVISQIIGDEE